MDDLGKAGFKEVTLSGKRLGGASEGIEKTVKTSVKGGKNKNE